MKPFLAVLTLGLTLSFALGACTFYVNPEPEASVRVRPLPEIRASQPEIVVTEAPVITDFAPTRGAGSVYALGEEIRFQVRSTGGYATLTVTGPDGSTSVLAQSVYIQGSTDVYLPTPEQRVTYTLAPPRGLQRATLSLTSDASGSSVGDTAETTFYIQ